MAIVQIFEKPSAQTAAAVAAQKKEIEVKKEFLELSRAPKVAAMVQEEYTTFKAHRAERHDRRWRAAYYDWKAQYDPSRFTPIKGRSDVFLKRTRERVVKCYSSILDFTMPLTGEVWDLELDPIVDCSLTVKDPEKALDGMRRQVRDDLHEARWRKTWRDAALTMSIYGTTVIRAPRGSIDRAARTARIARLLGLQGPAKKIRPKVKEVRLWDYFIDPFARRLEDASACIVRHVLTTKQLRDLVSQGFEHDQIEALIATYPEGNYEAETWEAMLGMPIPKTPRYLLLERWGLITDDQQVEIFGEVKSKGFIETWTSGSFLIHAAVDTDYEDKLPFYVVPLEVQEDSPYGRGTAEMMEDLQALLNSIVRNLHDNLAASSLPIREIDMTQLAPDADLADEPGKAYQARPNELSGQRPAVRHTILPNNSPQLVQAFGLFESMIPTATSMPAVEDPRALGSGMRTLGQMKLLFQAASAFIRVVIGNVDEFLFEPMVEDFYQWELAHSEDNSIKGAFRPVVTGMSGALRREAIAQAVMELGQVLTLPAFEGWANTGEILKELVRGYHLDDRKVVFTPEEKGKQDAYKNMVMAQQQAMVAAGQEQAAQTIKASTSASDTALQLAKSIDDTNPAWGAAFAEAAEKAGIATPQLYAGLNVWAQGKAAEYAQMGFVEAQQNPFLTMTFQPQDATDMAHKNGLQKPGLPQADPELVQQAQQMAQQATPAPEAALADPAADPTAEPALVGMA